MLTPRIGGLGPRTVTLDYGFFFPEAQHRCGDIHRFFQTSTFQPHRFTFQKSSAHRSRQTRVQGRQKCLMLQSLHASVYGLLLVLFWRYLPNDPCLF
ncbi:hypothetical protein FA13DRAFT_9484 [Coprinellus micaceus]|uniref:Uncharacterized protein n=1 Tax=Coprinellus micaceus TaxID=71717 RepID=A0A4Y7U198_COPMI|nr:hypothetical protein FA13DRAFT_852968 [Coprinellus micaceus]TEB39562.1 hypothetical protein FA13DRAFT_9484 [Coprinellus micaceus]